MKVQGSFIIILFENPLWVIWIIIVVLLIYELIKRVIYLEYKM